MAGNVRLRIETSDQGGPGQEYETADFPVGNDTPVITVTDMSLDPVHKEGVIAIELFLYDSTSDSVDLDVKYSTDAWMTESNATITVGVTGDVPTSDVLPGLRTAIGALPHLPGMQLVVVGDGRGRRYRRLAKELRVDDRVRWLGYVEDLARLYRSADLLVHPTHYDTASLVVLEALASGTPPITTVRDGNADLAQAGGGAALSRPGDPALLCEAVLTLLATSRSEAADRARAAAEEYPLAKMLDRVVETLTGSGG